MTLCADVCHVRGVRPCVPTTGLDLADVVLHALPAPQRRGAGRAALPISDAMHEVLLPVAASAVREQLEALLNSSTFTRIAIAGGGGFLVVAAGGARRKTIAPSTAGLSPGISVDRRLSDISFAQSASAAAAAAAVIDGVISLVSTSTWRSQGCVSVQHVVVVFVVQEVWS